MAGHAFSRHNLQSRDDTDHNANKNAAFNLKSLWPLTKQAVSSWIDDFAPSMGAALSYYTLFSLAPLLLIVIAIAGLVFGQEAAQGGIFHELQGLIGNKGAAAVQDMLKSASNKDDGILATVIGSITLLIGATTVFGELQSDLNRIWKTEVKKGSGIWNFLRARLLSFGMILGIGFLLIVSLMLSAGVTALSTLWGGFFGDMKLLLEIVNFAVSFSILTLLFAMIYKLLPDIKLQWRDVWFGAAVTSALFTIGKFLIGLYLGKSDVASAYGAAGALVILLLWVYYSAQIFLFGAEFTKAYADLHGSKPDATDPSLKKKIPESQ